MQRFDGSAIGSDIPRSFRQYAIRVISKVLVSILGLNRAGSLTTEIVQAIGPVATIPTRHGPLYCRCNHGRLLWRARTFHTEEPQTIEWLDALTEDDILWDVGANVGLYSVYASKFKGCQVIAFEPESQNYALLIENIVMNGVAQKCLPACLAISSHSEIGRLRLHQLTKGGAHNMFMGSSSQVIAMTENDNGQTIEQVVFGVSLDELIGAHNFEPPTHLKIDVDGLEPLIIDGAASLLKSASLRGILIEINRSSPRDMKIPQILADYGFKLVSERSNWLSRGNRTRENEMPTTNMIFNREDVSM